MLMRPSPRTSHVALPAGTAAMRNVIRTAAVVVVALLAYGGLCAALWRSGARGGDAFVVVPQAIDGSRAPAWLPGAEIARLNALGSVVRGRSILDPDLTRDLAACYMESPWVAGVLHIRRAHPNHLEVALAIRRPFAAVARASGPTVVLDEVGVRLPASADPAGLPLIEGISGPAPGPGEMWDDVRVQDGLRVLRRYTSIVDAELAPCRATKVLVGSWSRPEGRPAVEIVTATGFSVVWGVDLPNGEATIACPSAEEKLQRLREALPHLLRQPRPIDYVGLGQRSGLVVKYRDEEAEGR